MSLSRKIMEQQNTATRRKPGSMARGHLGFVPPESINLEIGHDKTWNSLPWDRLKHSKKAL